MFKFLFTMVLLLSLCGTTQAQFIKQLGKAVEKSAKNATVRKAEQKTDQTVSKGIDKATSPDTYKDNKGKKSSDDETEEISQDKGKTNAPQGAKGAEMAYAKSDFVPGDEIFFDDDLSNEKLGEFPSQWDLASGNAEVASIDGVKCISLIGYTIINPLMNAKNYLPDEFTIEYDVFGDAQNGNSAECEIGFNDSRTFIGRHWLYKDEGNFSFSWVKPDGQSGSQSEKVSLKGNQWNHISISFNKRALKYYVNGIRILNVPNMKKPTSIWLWARNGNAYYKNIRIAKGAVPLYDRLASDGKIITYGITFDVGKATIKPESIAEINRIAELMNENPDVKFSVEGHTDNTGNAASNQTLSESRSKAVMDKLVEMGIAKDRLKAAGKGQTSPIASNSTDEGRAKNRRVEFVKM
ncbi:MAG: OmpA family protein [Flavobacteriaceae bacterium]|nr:OmpA family protein [Flavobacteriaceae bacterium]